MTRAALLLLLVTCLSAQSPQEVEITAEPDHHQVLANNQVRVFSLEIPPHSETKMHWHRHDYAYVQLGAAEVVNKVKGKDPVTVKLEDGQAAFLPAPFAHLGRNPTGQPFHGEIIEILQDEKLRHTPSPWPEDRALNILEKGTQQILFVKDAIRVTEFELQPGGQVPLHHHAGPRLAVALTDYELRSDQHGKPPSQVTLKTGQSIWVPGGFTHTLTNVGKQEARWITLEFP
jgi:quercetin dioxygenase-like cupin family protein